jgi:Cytochrome C'
MNLHQGRKDMNRTHAWLAGLGLLALGMVFIVVSRGMGGGEEKIKKSVLKIAAAIEKGDKAGAAAEAKALAKSVEDIEDVMAVFKLREKHGIGVGPKANAIVPDGIELKLLAIGRDAPGQATVNKEAEALEKMAYVIAAVAEVAIAKPPAKDEGKKKRKDFIKWAKDMREAAPGLAAAAKSKSPAEIQKAAAKINSTCSTCHSIFK